MKSPKKSRLLIEDESLIKASKRSAEIKRGAKNYEVE